VTLSVVEQRAPSVTLAKRSYPGCIGGSPDSLESRGVDAPFPLGYRWRVIEPTAHTLPTQTLRSLALADEILPDTRYLAAASGLAIMGDHFVVVADDALHLALFPVASQADGSLFRLRLGELPSDPTARKREKPDFEALTVLPSSEHAPSGALLVVGSGSTRRRELATLVRVTVSGELDPCVEHRDLRTIFAPLRDRCGEINIEAAFVQDRDLVLVSRGNGSAPNNHVAHYRLESLSDWLSGRSTAPVAPSSIAPLRLPAIGGVPLGVTDATPHPDGGWLFSAVAEDTADSYTDGALTGAIIGHVDTDGRLTRTMRLSPMTKVEGIAVSRHGRTTTLIMVTDGDDPATPASLLCAELSHAGS
jgi:hypothetical protein